MEKLRELTGLYFDGRSTPAQEKLLAEAALSYPRPLPADLADDLKLIGMISGTAADLDETIAPPGLETTLALHTESLAARETERRWKRFRRLAAGISIAAVLGAAVFTTVKTLTPETSGSSPENILAVADDEELPPETATPDGEPSPTPRVDMSPSMTETTREIPMKASSPTPRKTAAATHPPVPDPPRQPNIIERGRIADMVAQAATPPISNLTATVFCINETFELVNSTIADAFQLPDASETELPTPGFRWRQI